MDENEEESVIFYAIVLLYKDEDCNILAGAIFTIWRCSVDDLSKIRARLANSKIKLH